VFGYRVVGFGSFPSRGADYKIQRGLMFDGTGDYLRLTPSAAGSTSTATYSFWVKRSGVGDAELDVLNCETNTGGQRDGISFGDGSTADLLSVRFNDANDGHIKTNDLMRDPTAWQHWVVAIDTGQDAPDARVKIYKNGTQITSFATASYPAQNYVMQGFMQDDRHFIGTTVNENNYYFDGYLTEFIGIDGIQLAASAFGETDTTGVWIPKDPSNTANIADWGGKNSFWLKFDDGNDIGKNSRPNAVTANSGTYKIDYSIYLDGSDDYLSWTPSDSASSNTDKTISFWIKRVKFGSVQWVLDAGSNNDQIQYTSGDQLEVSLNATTDSHYTTKAKYRDATAWTHIVIAFDTDSAAANRKRLWINGVLQEDADLDNHDDPSDGANVDWMKASIAHNLGRRGNNSQFLAAYLAEFIGIDGVGADASNFGGWDANGIWQPVDPSGLTSLQGQVLIPQDTGSTIGTMNTRTSAAFDGNNNQDENASASHSSAASTVTIGKDFGSGNAKTVNQVKVWGYSGGGFTSNASATCTIAVIGSNTGLGSNEVTLFTSGTIADTTNANEQNFSFNNTTAYRYVYIKLTQSATNYFFVAELEFYHESTVGYGENGFLLQFKGDGGTFDSNADAGGVGADTSGKNNHWTGNGTVHSNRTTDTPTNTSGDNEGNYPVFNPLSKNSTVTLTNGNLTHTGTDAGVDTNTKVTIPLPDTGKFYFEFTSGSSTGVYIGVVVGSCGNNESGNGANKGFLYYQANGKFYANPITASSGDTYGATWTTNDVIGVAIDMTNGGDMWFAKNNTWQSSATASEIAAGTTTNAAVTNMPTNTTNSRTYDNSGLFVAVGDSSASGTGTINFGQKAFSYTPPTGFGRLSSASLATPTVTDPRKYFATMLYTTTAKYRSVRQCFDSTGTAWTPDFLWFKNRTDDSTNFTIEDSVRGVNKGINFSSANVADQTPTYDGVLALIEGGFTTGADSSSYFNNPVDKNYVAFAMRAGGSPSTIGAGSISTGVPTIASSVSAADHGGFSIGTFTAGANGAITIGHGLSRAPSMIIVKDRESTGQWWTYHESMGTGKYVALQATADQNAGTADAWNDTAPTASVFSTQDNGAWLTNGNDHVFYAFARTPGLIGIGSYTGNNSDDGPYVVVDDGASGFRPAFLLLKEYSGSNNGNWFIRDSARNPYNPTDLDLMANSTDNEYTDSNSDIDFTANGFKIRCNAGGYNENNAKNLYLAFADQPFSLQARAR